ncbi:MAG: ABC transporter ATP-binding protein [Burkholderiales bacterium]|nr:ABC transporter ATP-binding protein [Burkholderiales bacterium]
MLELRAMGCGYGQIRALDSLDLTAAPGTLTALLGPNGAGKTSTMMAIAGHVQVQQGAIWFEGRDITRASPVARTRAGISIAPEGRRIFPDLTVAENLLVGGYTRRVAEARAAEARVLDLFPRLRERHRQRAGSLSGGEQQMLAIGRALMAGPRLLLVDELSLGLMPAMVDVCLAALLSLKDQGLAIVLVEQNTQRALDVADSVTVVASGRVVFQGSGAQARADPDLVDSFLGLSGHGPPAA